MGFFDDKGMFGIDMNLDGKVTVEDDLLFMAMVFKKILARIINILQGVVYCDIL